MRNVQLGFADDLAIPSYTIRKKENTWNLKSHIPLPSMSVWFLSPERSLLSSISLHIHPNFFL